MAGNVAILEGNLHFSSPAWFLGNIYIYIYVFFPGPAGQWHLSMNFNKQGVKICKNKMYSL